MMQDPGWKDRALSPPLTGLQSLNKVLYSLKTGTFLQIKSDTP